MAKCPKCQYFSFDSGDRCRNCGYDFSLALDPPPDDLEIQRGTEPIGPLGDFSLHDTPDTPNLPLFTPGDPDAPLVTPATTPRAPLSVRRGAPPAGRAARPKARADLDPEPRLALDTAEIPIVPPPVRAHAAAAEAAHDVEEPTGIQAAGTGGRLGAAAIDLALLAGIDLMVLYFTLKVCDLTFADVLLLPAAPLVSFLLLLDGGYLSTFVAAGGQTIGKMATGIRVVPADPAAPASERVTFGHAVVRAAAYFVSLAPAGLGFLPVFFGRERRGLHDRLADTRVIRA
jgi:uncharacterized RDD family membrane protein YckC